MGGRVVGLVVVGDGQAKLVGVGLGDGQRAGSIGYRVVTRNARNLTLLFFGQVVQRAFGHIGDGRGRPKRSLDGRLVSAQRTGDGVFAVQWSPIIRLGLGLRCDGKRQRIVKSDLDAASNNLNLSGGIGAVLGQRVASKLIEERRSRGDGGRINLRANNLAHHGIVSNLCILRALEVMMHGDVSLVQFEVRIVGVGLIETAFTLARHILFIRANRLSSIIDGPIFKYICSISRGCGRASGIASVDPHGLRRRVDRAHASAIRSNRVIDGDFVFLPHCEQIVVGLILIGSNLSGSIAIHVGETRTRVDEEVSSLAALGLGPTLERVARASLGTKNGNALVDPDVRVSTVKHALAIVLGAKVAIPVDVGGSLFSGVFVHCFQLNGVIVVTSLLDVGRSNHGACFSIGNLRIALMNREGCARKDGRLGVDIRSAIPCLQHPVIEQLRLRRSCSRASAHLCIVDIQGGIARRIAAVTSIVDNADAFCPNGYFTPLGVEVEFLGDPETVYVAICRCFVIAPPVMRIGHVSGLVIGGRNRRFVQHSSISERLACRLVSVPTIELVAIAHRS